MKFLILLLFLVSCVPSPKGSKGVVNLGVKAKQGIDGPQQTGPIRPTLSNVVIQSGNLVVEGSNLDEVIYLQINGKGDGQNFFFDIISKTANKIVAQARQSTALLAETFLNLVLHEATGSTSYPVTVVIPDGSITAEKLDDMNAQNGQILKYNLPLGKWEASDLDGLNYKGAWNVNTMTPDLENLSTVKKGDYYVVNIGGDSDLLNPGSDETWNSGDWAVYNGSFWERINNTGNVTDVNGLTGPSIQLKVEDLFDVNVTGLNDGQTLVWDNANSRWKPADVLTNSGNTIGESDLKDNSVTNSKISDNSISITKIQDSSISSAKILNNTILNEDINSNANIDATKIGTGVIDQNEFNHLNNVSSNVQVQLDARLKLDGSTVMTGDLNLGGNGISNVKNVGLFNLLDNTLGPIGTSNGETGQIRFKELTNNGSNYVGFKAPDNLAASLLFTLPTSVGNPGDVLQTDGVSGRMSWDKVSLSNLSAGTPEHVLVMDAVGGVTTEAQLKVLRGGTNKSSYEDGSIPYYDSATTSLNESPDLKFDDTNLRLGIGTASDTINAKLHVKTAARATAYDVTDSTTWADQILENPTSVTDSATGLMFRVDENNNGYAGIAGIRSAPAAMDLAFITNPAGNLTGEEVMRITEAGQVGINTTTPNAELHVEGSVYISSDMIASDSITVSNIKIEGNTISSLNTDGSINIIPDGAGTVSIGDAAKSVKTSVDLVSEATQFSGITFFDDVTEKWFIGQGSATSNDKLIFRRDGTNNDLVIDTNGNIGVGETLTPGGLLSLGESLAHNKLLIWQNADASSWFGMGAQANQWSFSLDVPADKFSFYDSKTQTTEIFTILGSGRAAVGDSSPEARFGVVLPDSNGAIANDHLGVKLRLNSNQNNDSVGIGFAVNSDEDQKYKAGIFFQKGINSNSRGDLILANSNDDDTTSVDTSDARIVIKNDGKVGVGSTSPSSQLEVRANSDHFRMVEADNSDKSWDMQVQGSNLLVSESSVGPRMTIEAGGEVGIGTTTPSTTLHISTANQSPLRLTATSGTTTGITMDGNDEANDQWRFLAGIGPTKEFVMGHFDGTTTTNFLRFVDTVSDPNFAYFSDTNVGIQNDSPASLLHIGKTSDTANRVLKLDSGYAAGIEIDSNDDDSAEADQNAYLKLTSSATQIGVLGYINQNDKDPFGNSYTDGLNGALLLSSNGNPKDILQLGTSQEARVTIDGLGRVGVGTKNPTARLSVAGGGITQTGGDVNLSSGSLFIDNLTGNVGIGSIAPNAVLDINSTTSGVLFPRLTNSQRDAIASPSEGTLIFNTEDKKFNVYADGSWQPLAGGGGGEPSIVDADSDTKIQVEESADDDTIRFDTAGSEMATLNNKGLDVNGFVQVGTTTESCTSSMEGATRYNSTDKVMEFCNGTEWIDFASTARKYYSASSQGNTTAIPEADIIKLCADFDGCKIIIGMYNWNGTGRTASRTTHFYYNSSNRNWRVLNSDVEGTNNNGVVQHIYAPWSCYFTDGTYSGSSGSDSSTNFGILNWNQYTGETCRLTIVD